MSERRPRCFDARKIDDTGIGRYVRGLLRELPRLDPQHEYAVLLPPGRTPPWNADARMRPVYEGARNYTLRELLYVPYLLRRLGPALVHVPHYTVPLVSAWRSVVTIQDLIHLRFAEYRRSPLADVYARLMFRRAASCDRVITLSRSTRDDVVKLLGADPARVRVTPAAADPSFRPVRDRDCRAAAAGYGLRGDYLLYVGLWRPHKNLPAMIRAFAGLAAEWHGQLALVGPRDPKRVDVDALVRDLGLEGRVVSTGFVRDEDLPALYTAATASVLPSLYEGFGLSVLESMACGTPVVATRTSSIPEVAGDAALLVAPGDDGELARAMRAVVMDGELRKRLSAAGLERAALFAWERTARETLAVYDELEIR